MAKKTGKGNTEFDLGPMDDAAALGLDDLGGVDTVGFDEEQEEAQEEFVPEVDVKLNIEEAPNPKANYVEIFIDEVEGKPGFEVVGVNGKIYQIKRGETVSVPSEVVEVLRNSIETKIIQSKHPVTGEMVEERRNRSAIPWRKV